jgi:DNA-binding transcriptional MerR regulator
MRIGEVAELSGLSTATIRFYERRGLLPGPGRATNGYREYSHIDLDRTAMFARLRGLGIEAPEAARLADQCATGHCDLTVIEMPAVLAGHRAAIGERIAESCNDWTRDWPRSRPSSTRLASRTTSSRSARRRSRCSNAATRAPARARRFRAVADRVLTAD